MTRFDRVLASLLAVAFVAPFRTGAAQDGAQPAAAPGVAMHQAFSARLTDLDGKQVLAGRLVRIVDAEGKRVLAEVTTDAQGGFVVPSLACGSYWLVVGGFARQLVLSGERAIRELTIMAAKDAVDADAVPLGDLQQLQAAGLGFGLIIIMIVGGGVVVTGGVVVAYQLAKAQGDARTAKRERDLARASPSRP